MPVTPVPAEQLSYEAAFAELESLIRTLESNPPSLEDALALYERGKALERRCAGLLDKAELRVSQLAQEDAGAAGQ
jgi:exodeoxyribonuclease VII small subunit